MIDLKSVITKYPQCLETSQKLKAFLIDLYTDERPFIAILVSMYNAGMFFEIQSLKSIDDGIINTYCSKLKNEYGYDLSFSKDCIKICAQAFDVFINKSELKASASGGEEKIIKYENGKQNVYKRIQLDTEQIAAFKRIETTNYNFFITGKAGTGKSVLLQYFIANTTKKVAVVAPTGIAAITIGGQTIHSLFGLKPCLQNTLNKQEINLNATTKKILSNIETLVIDEISMVRCDIMDMMDSKLRKAKNCPDTPFGGCQIVAFGDLYQLAPVMEKDDTVQKFLSDVYGSEFFFAAPGVKQNPFRIIELKTVHRQKDIDFINILNSVRIGKNDSSILNKINTRNITPPSTARYITLTAKRSAANKVNIAKLNMLPTQEHTYHGNISGGFKADETPTDIVLKLKIGAQVMMINNDSQKRWSNGTLGIVSSLGSDKIQVDIKGTKYWIEPEIWHKYHYKYFDAPPVIRKKIVGTFEQFPIKLAYAITIHKSQGRTFDSVKLDYSAGHAFSAGQTYVALSRCKSLDGLYLQEKLVPSDIKVQKEIVDFSNKNTIEL